jgi:cytidylate kinase
VNDELVTISGPPGSGKSTAGRHAARRLGFQFFSAGDLFRAEAARRGLTLEELGRYAEAHDEVDRALDDEMLRRAVPGRVLDGRLTGALCRRHGVVVEYVLVTAQPDLRAVRLAKRDGGSVEEARQRMLERESSERRRYQRIYGIDLDAEPADLAIDTSDLSEEGAADRLVRFVEGRRKLRG